MAKAKKDIEKIVGKKYPEFIDAVSGLSLSEIESRIATYAKEAENTLDAKSADEELARAQSLVSELKAPYDDATKAIRLKIKYLIALGKERGSE